MYKLEVRPAPDSDASEDEYHFVVNDLVSSIESILDIEENMITKDGNSIFIDCKLSEKEIKDKLKIVFTHHFEIMRFSKISEC